MIPTPPPPKSAATPETKPNAATPTIGEARILNSSLELNKLFFALAKAQGEFTTVKKDAENPFFKSNYATLAALVEMIRKPLADNGLAFMQSCCGDLNGKMKMNTIITHSSGQFIISSIPFSNAATKPQEIGSAITYAKRYGLQAALGVVVADDADDDDGEHASGR